MGGILGFFDYNKEGAGVEKEGLQKRRFVVFFEIYTRKFWQLVKLNLLFFLFNLPAFIAESYFFNWVLSQTQLDKNLGVDFYYKVVLGIIFLCIPVITVGPAQAGFTYVLRNYAREEHAWIWSDFVEHALKNFKQSMIISLIDLVAVVLVVFDFKVYSGLKVSNILFTLSTVLLGFGFVIFIIMHMYIYPMLVTFKLSIKQIYKNAFIFSIIKLLPNLGMLLLCVVLIYGLFLLAPVAVICFPLITLSTLGLITNFYVYPKIKAYMMDTLEQQENSPEEQI